MSMSYGQYQNICVSVFLLQIFIDKTLTKQYNKNVTIGQGCQHFNPLQQRR
ncbi:hypothetical protein ANACAC_01843 [Anaerostipes caccae L1-92]|uniref:Uncharacterized protein n=1 Tax=Anaerostipes caccae (strain DSM 14662 / CCUG 47493 / JCM 13470 / NCIMB 13811 / L1-92) TaxID=411490 RepID=B0ME49_ANACD|nr:hypothetical protein ANACAC_01843 [Anaerostipes caccae L1-92]